MKKFFKAICAAGMAISLAACSDAVATLNDKSEEIMTIGKTKITKGELYTLLRNNNAGNVAVDRARRRIAAIEVETTDEILERAQTYVDSLKDYYGDNYEAVLEESGGSEEEFLDTYVSSLKVESLTATYIKDHFDEVCAKYTPVKAIVLTFTDGDNAAYCQRALSTNVLSLTEAAQTYGAGSSTTPQFFTIDSTTYDAEARAVIMSNSPEDDWTLVIGEDYQTYYVIHVESNNAHEFEDDVIQQLTINGSVEEDCTEYYFTKYDFHVYDKVLFDQLSENASYALIQVPKDED